MTNLTQVHKTSKHDALNVVFVHGLGGDARLTWMSRPTDRTSLWPSWIGEDADCNVWIAGYGAALSGWTDAAMHLTDQGEALFAALQVEPGLQVGKLVLVGHSLGGLVIKSGMTQAQTLGDSRLETVLARIAAVVFIGTPHQGANLATIASNLGTVLRTNPQVVNMASNDAWLKLLNGQFRNLQARREFGARVFFETKGVLLGWKIWRIQVGRQLTIVDRNSSHPGIPGVVPTGLEADHFEIAKPKSRQDLAHKALLVFLALLNETAQLPTVTSATISGRTDWPERQDFMQRVLRASVPLLSWPNKLPDGTWLQRPELDALHASLDTSTSSLHYLLGEPGCGKSSLLVRLAQEKQVEGWVVLAIKADRLPVEVIDRDALNSHLSLGTDAAAVLRHFAKDTAVLVVIDQLDALADLVVQQSARLRVLLDFVQDLSGITGVHTVISCRTFEHRHDPALRNLDATVVTLELPAWPVVLPILESRGLRATAWNDEIKQVLRSPHALDVFLTLLEGATEPAALKSFQGLLEQQWEAEVLSDQTGKRRATLRHLAKLMAEREVLGLPLAIVEEHFAEIRSLAAAGLLRVDQAPGRVEFRHQTLYEFVRARSFLEESGSLTEAVRTQQTSLRIRPQLWHALGYFRGASPEEYGVEIGKLWEAGLRPHLKMLLIEFLGRQTSPLLTEQHLVEKAMKDPWFLPRFMGASSGSPGWFTVLARTHLPRLMSSSSEQAVIVFPVLREAMLFDSSTVIDLLSRYWLPSTDRDIASWQVLSTADIVPQPGSWLDNLVLIAGRTPISAVAISHIASVVSASFPDEAPKIVAAWLKREIEVIKASPIIEPIYGDIDLDEEVATSVETVSSALSNRLQELLESRQLHDVETIADAAPKAFVLSTWPTVVEALTLCSPNDPNITATYRQSVGLMLHELDEEEYRHERPLLRAVELALHAWAESNAEDFLAFADAQADSEVLIVHRLMAIGRLRAVRAFPHRVFNYLIADRRRLALGPYSDVHKESVALIEALSPHLDDSDFACLEAMLVDWRYYKNITQADSDASDRHRRLLWDRQHRLRLLRALPATRCSTAIRRLIEEEERAFPGLQSRDVYSSGAQFIGSPVSAEQMEKASDSDVLNLFNELTDESEWDHPRDRMRGGAIQAGRELAGLAKRDLEKTLRIVRALEPARNEIPVANVLRELVPAGLAVHAFYSLVSELEDKGFISTGFRRDAAFAIANVCNNDNPAPDELIDRIESWLTPPPCEVGEDSELDRRRDNSPVLWGHGSISVLPNGNYPTLKALTAACFSSNPARTDRWLDILQRHADRNDTARVWGALFQRELLQLSKVERSWAESLIDKLLERVPAIVNEIGWTYFVAHANHWATAEAAKRWIIYTIECAQNKQGGGELVILRHALFPAESWTREKIYSTAILNPSIKLGLAHGVAHLWNDSITRPVVHPVLLQLLHSKDEQVLTALSAIFMRDSLATDLETQELLDALITYPDVLRNGRAEHLPELLTKLVTAEPKRVCNVANLLLDAAGDQMSNIATSWYLSTEWMLDIALQLQDMGTTERADGSMLFERMLEFNMPQAKEMTLELDKRMPVSARQRPPMRRRSRLKRI